MNTSEFCKHRAQEPSGALGSRLRWSTSLLGLVILLSSPDSRSFGQGVIGFIPDSVYSGSGFSPGVTVGWGTRLSDDALPIRITQIGIYDVAGDGLTHAHDIALWIPGPGIREFQRIQLATIGSGSAAEFIAGYRFVPITPFLLSPGQSLLMGTRYGADDPDAKMTPGSGRFAPQLFQYSTGGVGVGADLTPPTQELCNGFEGQPCYRIFPVNFLFEVVPEPSLAGLLGFGIVGLALVCRSRGKAGTRA